MLSVLVCVAENMTGRLAAPPDGYQHLYTTMDITNVLFSNNLI